MPNALLYGVPYEVFWHLNPKKLQPFREAYHKRLEMEEYARWRNGLYVMQAVGACFGGTYPETPFGMEQEKRGSLDDSEEEEENYTEEEIMRAREALVVSLSIMEGRNQRAKAREERQKRREQEQQESGSE